MGEEKLITLVMSGEIPSREITNIISPPIEYEHTAVRITLQLIPDPFDANDYRAWVTPFWITGMPAGIGGFGIPPEAEPLLPTPNISFGEVNTKYPSILVPKYYSVTVIPIDTPIERYTQYGLHISNPSTDKIYLQAQILLRPTPNGG